MDTEGAEVQALLDARQTLTACSVSICDVSEYSLTLFGNSKNQLIEIIHAHGSEHRILSPNRKSNSSQRTDYFRCAVLLDKRKKLPRPAH
jgi:hypothetical protein